MFRLPLADTRGLSGVSVLRNSALEHRNLGSNLSCCSPASLPSASTNCPCDSSSEVRNWCRGVSQMFRLLVWSSIHLGASPCRRRTVSRRPPYVLSPDQKVPVWRRIRCGPVHCLPVRLDCGLRCRVPIARIRRVLSYMGEGRIMIPAAP
jgi:hypothetical protein